MVYFAASMAQKAPVVGHTPLCKLLKLDTATACTLSTGGLGSSYGRYACCSLLAGQELIRLQVLQGEWW